MDTPLHVLMCLYGLIGLIALPVFERVRPLLVLGVMSPSSSSVFWRSPPGFFRGEVREEPDLRPDREAEGGSEIADNTRNFLLVSQSHRF